MGGAFEVIRVSTRDLGHSTHPSKRLSWASAVVPGNPRSPTSLNTELAPAGLRQLARIFHPTCRWSFGHHRSLPFIVVGAAEALSRPPRTHLPPDLQPGVGRPTRFPLAYPVAGLAGCP